MELLDITLPIRRRMVVYEGDPPVVLERTQSMAGGSVCNLSRLDFGVHSGTHIDAPVHFIEGAAGVETAPLDALMGSVFVVDATAATADIDAATLKQLDFPNDCTRLLFKTRNSLLWERPSFSPDFIGLTEDAAQELVASGLRLVGIDYLSVAPNADPAPTHIALLSQMVVILEGLDLRLVEPGPYRLNCLPMLIEGADGAPARAVLTRDD